MERCPLCEVVTGCVDYGYSLTPINVSKKNLPGLKRDTSQAVVETMQTQSDKFSRPGQNERKYGARNFGALVYDNMTKWRWTILNALHVAGAVLWSP